MSTDDYIKLLKSFTKPGVYTFTCDRGSLVRAYLRKGYWTTAKVFLSAQVTPEDVASVLESAHPTSVGYVASRCMKFNILTITHTHDLEGNPIRRARQPIQQELF